MMNKENSSQNGEKKQGRVKKTFFLITGISDVLYIGKSVKQSVNLLGERLSFLKSQTQKLKGANEQGKEDDEPYSVVIARSEIDEEALLSLALKRKRYWLVCMGISGVVVLFLFSGMLRLLLSGNLHSGVLHVLLTIILMLAAGALSFVKAQSYEFNAWRIRNRCNSVAENGTYGDFIESGGQKSIFNFNQAGQRRGEL
ncbi:TraX-like protein [Cronobacter turicensis]|nr:TraX-like protein [Klebsiella pneumoniae]